MKKVFIFLIAVMVLLSSVSLAEELSSMSDEDLLELNKRVTEEMERRNISFRQEYPDWIEPAGYTDADPEKRVTAFFRDWYQNRFDDMPALCASGWKAKTENPGLELAGILANRTPLDMEIIGVSGEPDDAVRTVSVITTIDRNNGTGPSRYFFRIAMEKEADGLWYINPEGLRAVEQPEPQEDPVPEAAFIAPNVIPAKGIEDFLGEWHYFRIVNEDGSEMSREEMLAEGIVDDHAEIIATEDEIVLYAASMGDAGSVKYEFIPDDGSLKILNGAEEPPVLRLTDNGMLMFSMPAYGSPSGSTTAYLVRGEP